VAGRHARLSIAAAVLAGGQLAGCGAPVRAGLLPARVSVGIDDAEVGPLTLLVELRRNARAQLDVRVAEGFVHYDDARLLTFEPPAGARTWRRQGGPRHPPYTLPLPSDATLLGLGPLAAWFSTSGGRVRCAHDEDACLPTDTAPPSPVMEAAGPGGGFRVWLEGSEVRVALPQVPEGATVWTGARALRGVSWVRLGGADAEPLVNRLFRGHGAVTAAPLAAAPVLDGVPEEWDDATPLVVDAPWQLQAGADVHRGALDASFSVAAGLEPTSDGGARACLAGRVRDDALGPEDRVELLVGDVFEQLPLVPGTGSDRAAVAATWFGATFEWCAPGAAPHAPAELPLAVTFVDHDGEDAPTRLASAPTPDVTDAAASRVSRGRLLLRAHTRRDGGPSAAAD
jgi:hypothetical protein